ncbi:unnamed protein product [Prunus brigantina]
MTKIPQKVMRYPPLKPRLQRLYMSTHTATDMRWHKEKRVDDDVMRHPADGEAWKEFDRTFPEFAADSRNVRLGLATDGFNPYGVLNQHHSTWPIFVFPYNLPPWKCMKKEYMMMTVLITEDPGRSIDVYLRPLVDELKDLWTNGENVTSSWHAGKVCYLGHRRWLPWDHEWREKDKEFDGKKEHGLRPREWSGDEILEQLNRLDFAPFGKTVSRTRPATHMNWTHKPMFFELPYWSKLSLRHNLDVMHVEKNVFDTLMGTILDIEGKTKDTIKARLDLEKMGIRRGLWMKRDSHKARRDLAFFSMKPNDKKEFLKFVSTIKFPDGYASNIARCVNVDGGRFTGLKSHDCHVFMQRLLPVGIRHLLPEDVVKPIVQLSRFFSQLSAKTLRRTDVNKLRHDIVQVLCKFEMIFPPAFFTSMIHVMVHLPEEALLAGPVNYRWMYPIERLLGELKKSALTFCGMYLKDVDTAFNRPQRNNDGGVRNAQLSVFCQIARSFGEPVRGEAFSKHDMEVAHWFVLNNCDEIILYLDEHEEMMKREYPSQLYSKKHREMFPQWFLEYGSVKIDHGLLSVNINKTWYDDDPYILANMAKQIVNVYAIPELDPSDNDVDLVDQRFESSMENVAQTLEDSNVIQEPFRLEGVSSREIPIQSITIDLGDLPRYDPPVGPNNDDDVLMEDEEDAEEEEEEEDWETESDDSDGNEDYYSSDDE